MMKKYLAVLLASLLLVSAMPLGIAADNIFNDATLDWGNCSHEYDNACDTTCNLCNITRWVPGHEKHTADCMAGPCIHCGVTMPATRDHSYTAQVTTAATCGADGVRTYTCTVCGDGYTEAIPATGAHTYDHACDSDCNVCGAERVVTGHIYDHACDDTCNICGEMRKIKGHVFDNDEDLICNICGAIRVPQDPNPDRVAGDVNDDGAVNNKDLVLMVRYLSGWKVQIDIAVTDVDGDGVFTMKDAGLLQRYLNGWDVELL